MFCFLILKCIKFSSAMLWHLQYLNICLVRLRHSHAIDFDKCEVRNISSFFCIVETYDDLLNSGSFSSSRYSRYVHTPAGFKSDSFRTVDESEKQINKSEKLINKSEKQINKGTVSNLWNLPSCTIQKLAFHKIVNVCKLILSAGKRVW